MHNRTQPRRQVNDFKMDKGGNVLEYLMKFEENCIKMAAIGDIMDQNEQVILLLGSLSDDCDSRVKIIENIPNIDMRQVKEMIQREHESLQRKESSEVALKATKTFLKTEMGKLQAAGWYKK
uniref:AlNc14C23G2333 protein n=1 Tax=Albugo laibachii Nc14 TaxID=890382 RepID=F0W629_9STRA|nr:AlNc14C23G2333 [Albugo laibachii Nc14]|eukprot:CCA16571.1 AlNc14C23G2333 [Albugo laibachii Nc14]